MERRGRERSMLVLMKNMERTERLRGRILLTNGQTLHARGRDNLPLGLRQRSFSITNDTPVDFYPTFF